MFNTLRFALVTRRQFLCHSPVLGLNMSPAFSYPTHLQIGGNALVRTLLFPNPCTLVSCEDSWSTALRYRYGFPRSGGRVPSTETKVGSSERGVAWTQLDDLSPSGSEGFTINCFAQPCMETDCQGAHQPPESHRPADLPDFGRGFR